MNKKELYIKARDSINKLMGKQELIEEYYQALGALSSKSDSLYGKPEQKALIDKLRQISGEKFVKKGDHAFSIQETFNPYAITTPKSKIKTKLALLNKLKQEYHVK